MEEQSWCPISVVSMASSCSHMQKICPTRRRVVGGWVELEGYPPILAEGWKGSQEGAPLHQVLARQGEHGWKAWEGGGKDSRMANILNVTYFIST